MADYVAMLFEGAIIAYGTVDRRSRPRLIRSCSNFCKEAKKSRTDSDMNKQAIVGLFTLLGLVALFAVFLIIANIGTGGRYNTAVHFKSAAGLHKGALVYESGVIVGIVDQTKLLPEDFTVDVIMAINNSVDIPRDSRFLIAAPLTGDATVEIVPPPPAPRPMGLVGPTPVPQTVALLPRQVLPIEQQPQGTNPATLSDLLEQGQGEVHRLDRMLVQLEDSEPRLLGSLQSAIDHANVLTSEGTKRLFRLTDRFETLTSTLQLALDAGSKNIVDMTATLDRTTHRNSANVDTIFSMLSRSSVALNQTVDQVRDLATDPQIHQNLLDTTRGLAQTATTIGADDRRPAARHRRPANASPTARYDRQHRRRDAEAQLAAPQPGRNEQRVRRRYRCDARSGRHRRTARSRSECAERVERDDRRQLPEPHRGGRAQSAGDSDPFELPRRLQSELERPAAASHEQPWAANGLQRSDLAQRPHVVPDRGERHRHAANQLECGDEGHPRAAPFGRGRRALQQPRCDWCSSIPACWDSKPGSTTRSSRRSTPTATSTSPKACSSSAASATSCITAGGRCSVFSCSFDSAR